MRSPTAPKNYASTRYSELATGPLEIGGGTFWVGPPMIRLNLKTAA
jgi:hypothetical protein